MTKSSDLTHWKCSTEALRSSSSLRIVLCPEPGKESRAGRTTVRRLLCVFRSRYPVCQAEGPPSTGQEGVEMNSRHILKRTKGEEKKMSKKNSKNETKKKKEKGRCIYPSERSAWEADFLRVGDGRGSAGLVGDYLRDEALHQSFTKPASSFKSSKKTECFGSHRTVPCDGQQNAAQQQTSSWLFVPPLLHPFAANISFTLKNLFLFNQESPTSNLYLKLCSPI